jgi:hypothetical protein
MVRWSAGVHVVGTRLWCDAARAHGVTFVSGGDVSLRRRPSAGGRVVASARTQRLGGWDGLPASFGRPFAIGRARLELLPAGRLPGSSQLRVELDGRVLLYAGAVDPVGAALAEPAQVRGCDELVLALAPRLRSGFVEAARAAMADGRTPLLIAPSSVVAAQAAAALAEAGLALRAPKKLTELLAAYRKLGVAAPRAARIGKSILTNEVVIWPGPPGSPGSKDEAPELPNAQRIPLEMFLDLPALVELAASTGASLVHVTSGFSDEAARAFAKRKLRAVSLGPPSQIVMTGLFS